MPAPFKRSRWKPGFVYAVPLADRSFGIAQAIAPVETWAVDLALFSSRFAELPRELPLLDRSDVVSIQATWRPVLNGGWWAKLGAAPLVVRPEECPNQQLLAQGGRGTGCTNSSQGLVEDFLSSYHGLIPWNLYPAFDFDKRLCQGVARPNAAKILDAASLLLYQQASQREKYDV